MILKIKSATIFKLYSQSLDTEIKSKIMYKSECPKNIYAHYNMEYAAPPLKVNTVTLN